MTGSARSDGLPNAAGAMAAATGMSSREAVRVIHELRGADDVVVTTMGSARDWMALGPLHALDLVYVPSSMGHATAVGLGLALAQPERRVIVCNGDGSMLMNLGSLVSITAAAPPNLTLIVFENGAYEVTGAQPTPASGAGRADEHPIDFLAVARACGFTSLYRFSDATLWARDAQQIVMGTGPVFVHLQVTSHASAGGPRSPGPAQARATRLQAALAGEPRRRD